MKQFAILLLLALPCLSQSDDRQRTNGLVNGRFWTRLSSASKLCFILGFDEAIGLTAPSSEKVYFAKTPYGAVVKGLNRFYREREKRIFPISDALQIFALKANGATQTEVETKVAELLKKIEANREQ